MGVGGSRGQSAAVASVVAPIVAATRGNNAAPQLLTFEMLDDDRDEKVPIETDQLAMDFGSLCGHRKFSDVTFIVGQREREKFYAHRMLLAARSKVFEAMFFSHFAESRGGDIEIPDVSPSAWRILMSAIYKDQVTLSGDVIIEVVYVAKKYQVHSLTAMALRFMQKGLTPDNACSLLEMAPHLLEDEKFAIDFIEKNAIEVMESPGFLNLTPHALSRVIRCDNLGMPELELFEKILLWAGKECERRKLEGTKPNMRRVLEPILPCIRFPTMSMEDVTLQVAPTELLSKDQLLAIYVWIGSKPESRLPIAFPTQPRAHGRSLWRLDTMRASPSVTLSQGNMHAKLMAHGHGYFLGSKEFSRGRHCWRVHLDRLDGAQWVFLGIVATQRRDKLKNMSFSDTSVYGFSTKNQIYHGGPTRRQHYWNRKFPTVDWNRQGAIIDLMLDCDESSLRILNTSSRREWKIERLPRRSYVPHFNVYDLNNEIRVETLRPEDWGVLSVNPTPASAAPPRRRRS